MTQANSKNSTLAPLVSTRRRFLSNVATLAAGGTALALAVTPTPAAALPTDLALSAAKASPTLRTAVTALNESSDRLEAAKAVFTADDLKMAEWSELHPEPKNRRAQKKHWRKWREVREVTVDESWAAQLEAEEDFRNALIAVANVAPRDHHDIMVKAATSVVYDRTVMARYGSVAIIGYSAANDLIKQHMAIA
jgi:hypothetical protein